MFKLVWVADLLTCLCILPLFVATASRNTAISTPQIFQVPSSKNLPETQEHHITLWILLTYFLGNTKQCHISPKAVNICSLFCAQACHCDHRVPRHTKETVDASFQKPFQILLKPIWCPIAPERQDCSPSGFNAGFVPLPPQFQTEKRIVRKEKVIVQLFL